MSDEYQIDIPPSFFALFTNARQRLTEPLQVVRDRYEACEDLANHLVAQAQQLHHDLGVSQDEVLLRFRTGLESDGSGVAVAEAGWVVHRLAELAGWPWDAAAQSRQPSPTPTQ